jgi:hypothetical protein
MKAVRIVPALLAAAWLTNVDVTRALAQDIKPSRPEQTEVRRIDRPERRDRPERPDRPNRPERPERPERPDHRERPDRERPVRPEPAVARR